MYNLVNLRLVLCCVAAVAVVAPCGCDRSSKPAPATAPAKADPSPLSIGIDSNYLLDMAKRGRTWSRDGHGVDPLALLAGTGCNAARIRLWVGEEGMNRLAYATQTALKAQRAGLKPYLVLFLSEDWADFVKQPAPAAWKDLPQANKLKAIETYAEHVVRSMADKGVQIDTFGIGNEIDFGICGEFEEQWPHRVSLEYMSRQVWPRMMPILKAAESGVLKAQPKARFVLHLTQWNNVEYCIALWRAMLEAGVQIDFAGLSYYPSSSTKAEERSLSFFKSQVAKVVDAIHRPVVICETSYPATAEFSGQFAAWNNAAEGYPLTAEGQAHWIADLLAAARECRQIVGIYYWSPEWYDGGLWDAFSLFDPQGRARPGVASFRGAQGKESQ